MKNIIKIFALLFISFSLNAQVEAELTIENRLVFGSDFFFDIYLKTTAASTGDLYLGNSDLVLTFDVAAFGTPVLSKDPSAAPGACTFEPPDATPANITATQELYFNNTDVSIAGGELRINLNGPAPADLAAFDSTVAKIDGTANLHRIGSFKISGMTNPNSNAGLAWKATGSGLTTKLFGMVASEPFVSSQSDQVPTDPTGNCTIAPTQMIVTSASPSVLILQADESLNTDGTVNVLNGTMRTYKAGQYIQLNQEFDVELGAEFDAVIEECNEVNGEEVKEKE